MSENGQDSFRVYVPFDKHLGRDKQMADMFSDVPPGMLGSVVRALILRGIKSADGDLGAVLTEASRFQAERAKQMGKRGRRRRADGAAPAVSGEVRTVAERAAVERVTSAPEVDRVQHVEATAKSVDQVRAAPEVVAHPAEVPAEAQSEKPVTTPVVVPDKYASMRGLVAFDFD
jgi:hypothetical protein